MKISGADHTSYTVTNLENSLEFYVGLLGFEVLWQREIANQYFRDIVGFPDCVVKAVQLCIPGGAHKLELFQYTTRAGTPADIRTNNSGSSHLALIVDDLPTAYAELKAKGARFRSPPIRIDAGAKRSNFDPTVLRAPGTQFGWVCTRRRRRSAFQLKRSRVWFLGVAPGCWNFNLSLDCERGCWCAGDTRRQ